MLDHHGGTHSRSPTPSLLTHSSEGKDDLSVLFCCIRCSFQNQWYQESESSIWLLQAREGAHPWLSLYFWNYDWVSRILDLILCLFGPCSPPCVRMTEDILGMKFTLLRITIIKCGNLGNPVHQVKCSTLGLVEWREAQVVQEWVPRTVVGYIGLDTEIPTTPATGT